MPSLYLDSAKRLAEICLATEEGKLAEQIAKAQFVSTLGTSFGLKTDEVGQQERTHRKNLMISCFPDLFALDDGPSHSLVKDLASGIYDYLREPSAFATDTPEAGDDDGSIKIPSVFDAATTVQFHGKKELVRHSQIILTKFLKGIRAYYDDKMKGFGQSQQYSSEKLNKPQKPRALKACLLDVMTQYLVAVMTMAMETQISDSDWTKKIEKIPIGPTRIVIAGSYKEDTTIIDPKDATLQTYTSQLSALLTSCAESKDQVKVQDTLAKTSETARKWIAAVEEKAKQSTDYEGVKSHFENFIKDEWKTFQAHIFKFVQESGKLPVIQLRHAKIVDTSIKTAAAKFAEKLKISDEIRQLATWYKQMTSSSEKMTKLHPLAIIDSDDEEDPENLALYSLTEGQKAMVSSHMDSSAVKEAANAANDYDMCVTPIIKLDDPRLRFDPPVYIREGDETIKQFLSRSISPTVTK